MVAGKKCTAITMEVTQLLWIRVKNTFDTQLEDPDPHKALLV